MDIQLNEELAQKLETFAREQQRPVDEIVAEAVARFLAQEVDDEALRADIRRIMNEHRWLLDELAR